VGLIVRSYDSESPPGASPIRRLGQNFLVDEAARDLMVSRANLSRSDIVLEVGPGTGFLTESLLNRAGKVIAVEKDRRLVELLRGKHRGNRRLRIVEGDVLKAQLPRFNKVVSCPPYYISSRLVLLLTSKRFRSAVLTLQKEFAERIVAKPGSSEYGRISVMVQHKASAELAGLIPRHSFRPVPKVNSAVVVIRRKKADVSVKSQPLFRDLVRFFFTQRRKKAAKVLRRYLEILFGDESMSGKPLPSLPDVRVFQLTVSDFERLSNEVVKMRNERDA
jgi:16S rRNA (adenine1518-N6/adenine1519-N6)-dimethyltransferase